MIKFVEYTGKYPNLCSGILVLDVDGKEYVFGGKRENGKLKGFDLGYGDRPSDFVEGRLKEGLYESFWCSGGSVWFGNDWDEHVESGPWHINDRDLPEELRPYVTEISDIFNDHVPWGCCGGCV